LQRGQQVLQTHLEAEDFNTGYRSTTEEHIRRTTTQEPIPIRTTNYVSTSFLYTQHTPAEGRFQHFREQELLNENRGATTTPYTSSDNEIVQPDWATDTILSQSQNSEKTSELGVDEPFLVTESLMNAFTTPNGDRSTDDNNKPASLATTKLPDIENESPTMKMFAWEMQRGDIDVRGANSLETQSTDQNTFTPISKRRPQPTDHPFDSNAVLMPQELPNDVDLPKTYEIGPRLVLPQDRDEGSGSSSSSNEITVDLPQSPPMAPPTLVSAERDHDEFNRIGTPEPTSLFTAPKRGGSGALLVPISTPQAVPQSLVKFGQKDRLPSGDETATTARSRSLNLANVPLGSFTRPVGSSLPSIRVISDDYSKEAQKGRSNERIRTLATKPPGNYNNLIELPQPPDFNPEYTNKPGYEPNGPPGIS
jgi:hypothetical protein